MRYSSRTICTCADLKYLNVLNIEKYSHGSGKMNAVGMFIFDKCNAKLFNNFRSKHFPSTKFRKL